MAVSNLDINECEVNPSRCANVENATQCVNIVGSATCISCSAVDNTRIWSYYEKPECCLRSKNNECFAFMQSFEFFVQFYPCFDVLKQATPELIFKE